MINERIALVMLEGNIPASDKPDPHFTRRYFQSIQRFANASLDLCETGRTKKFEEYLKVALRLFKEGNETVKSGIVNVYLFTITHALEKKEKVLGYIDRLFPVEIVAAYNRLHEASAL